MSLSNVQISLLERRRDAAKSALRFFKDKKAVKSTNNPFAFANQTDRANLHYYRSDAGTENTIVQSFEDAAHFGVGNCDEKARIVYASLKSNPLIGQPGSYVTVCSANNFGYDHVFVIVADFGITGRSQLKALPATTMVVDGWTEDWYFPKLPFTTAKWYGLSHLPNPRQLVVRKNVEKHEFAKYSIREVGMFNTWDRTASGPAFPVR